MSSSNIAHRSHATGRKAKTAAALAVGLSLSLAAVRAEEAAHDPNSLEDFVILEYVAAGAYSPGAIIAMDNNARILFECRNGRSVEELRANGIEFLDSQLEFLIATDLLVRDSLGHLYTTFPVLDAEAAARLRGEASELADLFSISVQAEAEALANALEAAGKGGHAYSVFFSYVLDGMVWGFFEEYRRVPPRTLSARRPFWAGVVWAVPPDREFWARTRSISSGGVALKVTSGPNPDPADALLADPKRTKQAVAQFSSIGRPVPEGERELLSEFGLVDAHGRWVIPVIDEVKKDPVFRAAESLTSRLVEVVLEGLDLEEFRKGYRFRTSAQALVILYHELMWELIDRFEAMGLASRPGNVETTESAASPAGRAGVGRAAFLVDRRKPRPTREDVVEPKRDAPEEPQAGDGR